MRTPRAGFLSPVVRRLCAEHGLDASRLVGTGADGRVTRDDVLAVIAARAREPDQVTPTSGVDVVVPLTPMRRRIAEHMVRSVTTSPHAFCSVMVDYEAVERVRRTHQRAWRSREGFALTYLPFVARALVDALRVYPLLNASVADEGLLVHPSVHLGLAVDLDRQGLVVPVIRDADLKRLRGIARDGVVLARRAHGGDLSPDDLAGGTVTITNPGPFGTTVSIPIINQPQVAIVAMDRIMPAPVAVPLAAGGDGIALHSVGVLGLSFDHRAVDLAYAAAFLASTRQILETRDWASEL